MLKLTIGTRGSSLALVQANWIKDKLLQHYSKCQIKVLPIKTTGDQIKNIPLSQVGGKGAFIKEIEMALLNETIDLAVHSMKDLPVELPPGLTIAAITKREDPFDVFVSQTYTGLEKLPPRATIATGSLRRKVQLLHYRSDFVIKEIRGNVDSRLDKLKRGFAEGLVLAAAALKRLNRKSSISQYLHPSICLPAAGQGALGIEIREKDVSLKKKLALLHDAEAGPTVTAERICLYHLGVDCHTPAAAYGEITGDSILLKGFVASPDGTAIVRKKMLGPKEDAELLGELLAKKIITGGGRELLAHLSRQQ
jgi:hydroxymethylbilane synthase